MLVALAPMMTAETPTRRPPGWLWLLLLASVAPLLAEQRIFTNPKPEGHFAAQFKGKSVFDRFAVGSDIDAISRASISVKSGTRAVRDSVRVAARAFLNPDQVQRQAR